MMRKWIAGILAVALCGGMVCGFAGCGGGSSADGEVSESEWKERLGVVANAEEANSFTYLSAAGCKYGKDEAATYGKWYYNTTLEKLDKTAQCYYQEQTTNNYVAATATEEASFETTVYKAYSFAYNDTYYRISNFNSDYDTAWAAYQTAKEETGYTKTFAEFCDENGYKSEAKYPWLAKEILQETYVNNTQSITALVSSTAAVASGYAMTYSSFEYQKDTGRYTLSYGGVAMSEIGLFGTDGFETYVSNLEVGGNPLEYTSGKIYDIGKTTVSVPDEVKAAIDYISE